MFADEVADTVADNGSLAMDNSVDVSESTDTSSSAQEEHVESFDELIKGKYKADYEAKIKESMDKRFKNQKAMEKRLSSANPIIEMVARKYGFDTSDMSKLDIDALSKTMMDDNSLYEDEAFKMGMDVESFKKLKQVEAENARLRLAEEERMRL